MWPPSAPEPDEITFRCLTCGAVWSAWGSALPDDGGWDIDVDAGEDECPKCPAGEADVDVEHVG